MNLLKSATRGATNTLSGNVNNVLPRAGAANSLAGSVARAATGFSPGMATFNPGVKATGAPVSFSPAAQSIMTSAFGVPMQDSYDRTMDTALMPPAGVETPITPPYDLNY